MEEGFELHQDGELARIALPAVLDLAAAEKFWTACANAHERGLNLDLDGSDVERLTTGCAQVMLSAAKTLEAGGMTLSLSNPSEAVRKGLEDLGLAEMLEKWSAK
ncbi:STAS domain-containing protein [Aestuariispira insulae]|uniref:STAS domain-containing protein n=1 Tax=Aestuariispira insulae TaxID=1461337 RepID=A0A3D9HX58_9PROT|nr:STAS domain-containing protein [Aestuariispira insulae]RED54077.1 STAS domain-containing protein [Aestuariispira insulae]